tara:strand:- start:111 stop:1028 length:918 start_codon:yes stop_codon:yes gene_type:complete
MQSESGLEFQPSTIETIDTAMLRYIESLNLHSLTNKGFVATPIIWVGAERAYQLKNDLSLRDEEGLLSIPLITIERKEIQKDPSKSPIPSNIPDYGMGGYIPVRRRIVQDKTSQFKSAKNIKKQGASDDVGVSDINFKSQRKFPSKIASMFDTRPVNLKNQTVYETVYVPIPVYINVKYEIHIRTEYAQQMNQLLTPFISAANRMGRNHKYVTIEQDNHLFEAFIDGSFASENNAAKLEEEERIFNSTVTFNVLGYLMGGDANEDSNIAKTYENIVNLKVSRERVVLSDQIERQNPSGSNPFYKE